MVLLRERKVGVIVFRLYLPLTQLCRCCVSSFRKYCEQYHTHHTHIMFQLFVQM